MFHNIPYANHSKTMPTVCFKRGVQRLPTYTVPGLMPSWLKSALAVAGLCTLAALAAVPLFVLVDDHRFEPRLLDALHHLGSEPALAFTATPVRYAPHESFTDVEINSTPVQRVATERVRDYR